MMKFKIYIFVFFTSLMTQVCLQLISPCPRLFKYDPKGQENDRWYGTVTLLSDTELTGIWLRLVFDKPSIQLGNWFGEVNTSDNKEFFINNRNHKLLANVPFNLRFYIKYNPAEPPPRLVMLQFNGRTVCPEKTTPTGDLLTKVVSSTTSSSINDRYNSNDQGGSTVVRPGGPFNQLAVANESEDGYFKGDIAIFTKTKPNVLDTTSCGTSFKPVQRTFNTQDTQEDEFPWHASLYFKKDDDLRYICGASLISKYHLVTAAHCVTKWKSQQTLDPRSLAVYLGKYYLKRWSNPSIQDRNVKKITVHPKYNPQSFSDDIAVIKLVTPIQLNNHVNPVCLWNEDLSLQAVINKAGTLVGWGFDENGRITEQLTKVKISAVPQESCINSYPDFYSQFTSNKTYCASFSNGTSLCNGDSGAGMVLPKSNSNSNNPIWQLRGLVTISVALQNQLKCDSSLYILFTDVAKYLDWIRASLN